MNDYRKMYFRNWKSTDEYKEFPYSIDGINNSLPENDVSANDVDLDSYTSTKGKTIRNRIRQNVASIDFSVETMTGKELHELIEMTKDAWFECKFFYEPDWSFVSKKMYRSGTISYHRYYIDATDPNKNIYTEIKFSFVEE